MRQSDKHKKETKGSKKDKMLLSFNKIGKGCVLDKSRKGIFCFLDNLRAFQETFRGKVYLVIDIIPVLN